MEYRFVQWVICLEVIEICNYVELLKIWLNSDR